jgi:hypothetical protein
LEFRITIISFHDLVCETSMEDVVAEGYWRERANEEAIESK